MSLETRSNSALFKRAEQLKRWEESDTNREPVSPKIKSRRVKFSSGCVFLAACAAGDKEEVLKLLEKGADINTANVDGLTALHQACIDDNLDMVEFLVEQGADVNRGDNEGWTPLHATASCGFKYIAKYLIEKGADVAAVNNDGELALDIAECQRMTDLLRDEIRKRGIDCDAARNDEEIAMLRDAKEWLATKSSLVNEPHPKTGASALHVAAAKGYVNVMQVLLQCGADIDAQDTDGWSPIHAAAHWGQEEACRLLVEHLADLDAKNYVGQTAFDLADNSMLTLLTNLKEKQDKEEVNNRKAKKRAETQDRSIEPDSLTQVKKVKVEITGGPQEISKSNDIEMENESESESEVETSESESEESSSEEEEKKNKANAQNINDKVTIKEPEVNKPPLPPKTIENSEEKMPWRQQITKPKSDLNSPEKSNVVFDDYKPSNLNNENEVTLRRTKSFQNDELFYTKYKALHARIQANNDTAVIIPSARPKSDIILTNSTESHYRSNEVSTSTANTNISASPTTTTSPQAQNNQSAFRSGLRLSLNQPASATNGSAPAAATTPTSTVTTPTTPGGTRFQIFKNFFKSFVPPVRDEESETQRKAHAKRVRETRRSTQGVTLEEIKSAEQLVKLKNQPNNSDTFKLEDATKPEAPNTPSFIRRLNSSTNSSRPSSAPIETAETTVTIPLRRPKSLEEKEQDKENDVRNAQATLATQAAIQRRRRPKRRSTGVVSFDNVEDMDQEKDPAAGGDAPEATKLSHESGSERSSRSRVSSTVDIRNENGEIDYKKLYEEQLVENDRLKDKLRKSDEELKETKQTLERINVVTSKNSLSELEKRERRAMERKLSEMEEELKNLENLKTENQRLKDENGALIRVISKLSK
uniref:Protein phosphatase 1 regulatory subunit 12B n=1 Tax=Dendroctonus ponderosae TaxID=77166 RepID=A0AAR5Q197_DENPD